jgi:paraquat-inducible protein B
VRTNSVFWNASGLTANLSLKGLSIHTESLAALLMGGIAFATPNHPGALVKSGSVFALRDELNSKWEDWAPEIRLDGKPPSKDGKRLVPELFHHKTEARDAPGSHHWFGHLFHPGKKGS